ncbi:MAG: lipopolysaccharide heptosyltransferase II [Victivallales bacterium]|nr:lipopolysaccharide heptosyltransferase II [Victivallales bacterium]
MNNPENIPDFGDMRFFPSESLAVEDWKDGIVVRSPNWLGDAVMSLPAMMQLRRAVPRNCGFFVVTPLVLKDLFDCLDFVDVSIALHRAHSMWSSEDIYKVRRLNAGLGLLMNNSFRDAFFFRVSGVPRLYGASARCRSFLLTRSFDFPNTGGGVLNKLHHAARYLSMSHALGAPVWEGDLPVFSNLKEPETTPVEVNKLMGVGMLLVVAPGAAYGDAKRWPAENFARVCSYWICRGGEVAVIGVPSESEACDAVSAGLPGDKVHNLCGKTDPKDLVRLLGHASFCVANDSGVMHLSAICGGSGVAIFGSTDPTSTSPVSRKWKILYDKQDCSPCFKRTCPSGSFRCLRSITPEKVIEAMEDC